LNAPAQPRFSGGPLADSPRVLLLVDWISTFDHEGAEQLCEPALRAARRTADLKKRLARQGIQSIYANDNFGVWRSDFRGLLKDSLERGGVSAEIARLLSPEPEDIAVLKARHSAFYETPLQLLLQQLHARELIVVGVATEWCALFTAMDAYVRGYSLWVPADCVASESRERHQAALLYMAQVLGANVSASDVVNDGQLAAQVEDLDQRPSI
jgi:nicotinamidase-related amidase